MKKIAERITAACASSIALGIIERYLHSNGNVLYLLVPLTVLGLPCSLALERPVKVEFQVSRRNKLMLGRRHESIALTWKPQGDGPYPTFGGRLTIRPLGSETELELEGNYEPPFGALGAAFDAVAGNRAARATAHALLGELKGELEREFAVIKETIEFAPSGDAFRNRKRR
jgi:hypothetical protein